MRLDLRLISIGSAMALALLAVPTLSATVLPNLVQSSLPPVGSGQSVSVNNVILGTPEISPVPVPSGQPITTDDFVSNPEINSPSPISLEPVTPSNYQVLPLYDSAPITPVVSTSPVSLLYTGSQDAPFGPEGPPVLNVNTPSEPITDLFTTADPDTSNVTTNFNNSPLRLTPAFAAVPEPRLASVMAVAAALAMGILVARRRKKEAQSTPQP